MMTISQSLWQSGRLLGVNLEPKRNDADVVTTDGRSLMSEVALAEQVKPAEPDPSWIAPLSKGQDRCDKCGSQAFVRTIIGAKLHDLMWCAHHYNQHEVGLLATEGLVYIHDERETLNASSSSASV